jgi:DNA-binding NarL/FixJ family response regulator
MSAAVADRPAGHPTAPALRVLVVDDQEAFRDVVAQALTEVDGFTVVGSLPGAGDLIDEVARLDPDLVLLDVRMPGEDGATAALRLRRARPELTVVLMSVFDVEDVPAEVLAAGVGFLPKEDLGPGALAELRDRLEPGPRALP